MLTPIPPPEIILRAMAEYCSTRGLTLTQLSEQCGNVAIATRLKQGRGLNTATYNRIVETINGET